MIHWKICIDGPVKGSGAILHSASGECRSDEYSCTNGRCIDQSLKCNGFNPCGDDSDCKKKGFNKSLFRCHSRYI